MGNGIAGWRGQRRYGGVIEISPTASDWHLTPKFQPALIVRKGHDTRFVVFAMELIFSEKMAFPSPVAPR
jgi:hypothetical protein